MKLRNFYSAHQFSYFESGFIVPSCLRICVILLFSRSDPSHKCTWSGWQTDALSSTKALTIDGSLVGSMA